MSYKDYDSLNQLNDITKEDDYHNEAFKYIKDAKNTLEIENNTIFLGLFCIKDPVKENVKHSILLAK